MAQGNVHRTPTGYGAIKVAKRKTVVLPKIDAPSLVQSTQRSPQQRLSRATRSIK
jgi:hypothetical protein